MIEERIFRILATDESKAVEILDDQKRMHRVEIYDADSPKLDYPAFLEMVKGTPGSDDCIVYTLQSYNGKVSYLALQGEIVSQIG